jgi:hypothetical protein
MKVVKYLGFNRTCADFKELCRANPKYLTYAKHGGIFLRYRLSETVITILTINASTLERYRYFYLNGLPATDNGHYYETISTEIL